MRLPLFLAAALFVGAAPPALAQTDSSIALGLSFAVTTPTNPDAESNSRPGLLLRLRNSPGLGSAVGFQWFTSAVRTTIAGEETYLGRISVRPVMAGPEYIWERGRVSASVSLQAGYAFTNIRDTGRAKQVYESGLGVSGVGIGASNAFAWCPNVSLWFDLNPRYAVMASVGYLGIRPTVTTTSSGGTTRERVNLGSVVTSIGIVYAIF